MIDPERGRGIALLMPYRDDLAAGRGVNARWLQEYWRIELPAAHLVIGTDTGQPFSKTVAVNDAFRQSDPTDDILVMIDADCYIAPAVILGCAERIRAARNRNERQWFVPYRDLYRLTALATTHLVESDPANALQFATPPNSGDVGSTLGSKIGHRFGALIQIFPREALIARGGLDPRFRGWGGEDVTNVRVMNTLYAIHQTTNNPVFTLWHQSQGNVFLRKWDGQAGTGANDSLSLRYRRTRRDPARMRAIIREWLDDPQYAAHHISPKPHWYET